MDRSEISNKSDYLAEREGTEQPNDFSGPSFTNRAITLLSTLNVAMLLSLFAGICYFYNWAYREAFFKSFGLDPNMVPITFQDAIAHGFLGVTMNVLWLILIILVFGIAYVLVAWFVSRYIDRIVKKPALVPTTRALPATVVELERNGGFRILMGGSILTFGITAVSIISILLIGLPGDRAGKLEADQLRTSINNGQITCILYDLKGKAPIVGKSLGSTPERGFILSVDGSVKMFRLDDLQAITLVPIRCVKPIRTHTNSTASNSDNLH